MYIYMYIYIHIQVTSYTKVTEQNATLTAPRAPNRLSADGIGAADEVQRVALQGGAHYVLFSTMYIEGLSLPL